MHSALWLWYVGTRLFAYYMNCCRDLVIRRLGGNWYSPFTIIVFFFAHKFHCWYVLSTRMLLRSAVCLTTYSNVMVNILAINWHSRTHLYFVPKIHLSTRTKHPRGWQHICISETIVPGRLWCVYISLVLMRQLSRWGCRVYPPSSRP